MSTTARRDIRSAVQADLAVLNHLERACFADQAWGQDLLLTELARNGGHFLVCLANDRVLGMVVGWTVAGESEIARICVHPNARRTGLAASLLDAFESHAARCGSERIFLEVRANNKGAHAFYANQNYRQCGCRAGYYRDGTDALLMEKVLRTDRKLAKEQAGKEQAPC